MTAKNFITTWKSHFSINLIWVHLWRFSTAWYGSVRFTFGGFSTGYSTWYFFITTSAVVPSDPYRYQNVTCKLYWSLIDRRESSLLRHWTCDMRPIDPLDLNQHRQRRIGCNFCIIQKISVSLSVEETFLSLIAEERIQWELDGATPKEKALCIYFWTCYIFRVCLLFIFLPLYLCFASIKNNLIE